MLGLVLVITAMLGIWIARLLGVAMLRPVADLTASAEQVSKSQNLQAASLRVGALEVSRLTTSFELLIAQLAEQNRELNRKQYELKTHDKHLEAMAFSDVLTGLPNRASFESTLNVEIATAKLSGRPLTVLVVDMGNLQQINDKYGHAERDAAVLATAARIRRALCRSDFLARLAGAEFVVISANVGSAFDAVKLGERLTVWLGISLPDDEWTQPIRASIGVTVFPDHGSDENSLKRAADQAMYRAKALSADDSIRGVQANAPEHAATTALRFMGFERADEGYVPNLPSPLLFETNCDLASDGAKAMLAKLATDLSAFDIHSLRLFGHTDNEGIAEYSSG